MVLGVLPHCIPLPSIPKLAPVKTGYSVGHFPFLFEPINLQELFNEKEALLVELLLCICDSLAILSRLLDSSSLTMFDGIMNLIKHANFN